VIGAASGEMVRDTFGLPVLAGVLGVMVLIGMLVYLGTRAVERFFAVWSLVLYAAYLLFFFLTLAQHAGDIGTNLTGIATRPGWFRSGVAYAGYNVAFVPALLFCLRHVHTRREAVTAGLLGGPIAMIPAVLFFVAMIGQYEALTLAGSDRLPVTVLLEALGGAALFTVVFPLVLFGTFVETGTALIHGVNERLARMLEEKGRSLAPRVRVAIALAILVLAIVVADTVGLTGLVAQGYGVITWGFLLVFVGPVLTVGVWRAFRGPPPVEARYD
jgi:uncharacterized membrane protein YkvI